MPLKKIHNETGSSKQGLKSEEAKKKLKEHGKNQIEKGEQTSPIEIFLAQFKDFLVWILIAAAIISFSVGHQIDTYLIVIIVAANGIFGFFQDWKAERSIDALKEMATPEVIVIRDGEKRKIESKNIVPGDIIILNQGSSVPADARIIDQQNLEVDESALTGESIAISKTTGQIKKDSELAERKNMLHKQTNVVKGKAKAIVVETGMDTEIGKIASELQEVEEGKTVFQKEVDELGKKLGILILGICALLIPLLYFRSGEPVTAFLTAIALAVAAIPEGLPAVVTLTLAVGTRKMVKRNALVRRLSIVESLGSVDVICTDKTGTLTESEMVVKKIYTNGKEINVTGGFSPEGKFKQNKEKIDTSQLNKILQVGALCNDSEIKDGEIIGDPTEAALIQSAQKAGLKKDKLETKYERIDEIPFSSERKMMTTIHSGNQDDIVHSKGAPEVLLNKCNRYWDDGEIKELTQEKKQEFLTKNDEYADNALRILGMAFKQINLKDLSGKEKKHKIEEELSSEIENEMIFLGLQGMMDPPRKEVKESIQTCRNAGIRTVMITGDNAKTAKAIASELGFNSEVITGKKINTMTEEELKKEVESTNIFARVTPTHKVKILSALKNFGHTVAMTGDGVNDAPSLKKSEVGVAMGIRGTDVSKQASDMVLLDDNFKTIKEAIKQGRGIFDNIRKFVNLLLSGNLGEVFTVFIASLLGWGLPLTAVMLLWVNLLTDGLPALALGVDPTDEEIMKRKPKGKDEGIFDKYLGFSIPWIGIFVTIICLALFKIGLPNIAKARTLAFTSLVILELMEVYPIRSRYGTPTFSNKWLIAAIIVSIMAHLMILYTPLNTYFGVTPLGIKSWEMIGVGIIIFGIAMLVMRLIENKYIRPK